MKLEQYRPRIMDEILQQKLHQVGAVLIQGPKWCGKTSTAERIAGSVIYMDDPERSKQYLLAAEMYINSLLEGENPRLIDEWQLAPQLWDAIRFNVDHQGGVGKFILTGSAVPVDKNSINHSGTGRFGWLTMRPLSLWESGDSTGEISLTTLFTAPCEIWATNPVDIDKLAFLICRGGWPAMFSLEENQLLSLSQNYYDGVVRSDLQRAVGTIFSTHKVSNLLRSYARNVASQASISTIANDMQINDKDTLAVNTINQYIDALRAIFVIEDSPAWNPNLRSKTAVRTAATRYFVDPSIATASLGIAPNDLLNDLNTLGLFFENLCVRDLRVYADYMGGSVYHYRDKDKLECDAVVHLRDGSYGLIEIKLGGETLIEQGAKNLLALKKKIDTTRMKSPSFMMVLVGVGQFAYRRPDDVYVVPIGCLKN